MPLKCKQHMPIHAYKHHPYINTHKQTFFLLNPFKSESRIHIDIKYMGYYTLESIQQSKASPITSFEHTSANVQILPKNQLNLQ